MVIHNHPFEVCIYEVILIDFTPSHFLVINHVLRTLHTHLCRQSQLLISIRIQTSSFKDTCARTSPSCVFDALIRHCSQCTSPLMIDKVITFLSTLFLYQHERLNMHRCTHLGLRKRVLTDVTNQTDYCN